MAHLEIWERQKAQNHQLPETVEERNFKTKTPSLECPECGEESKSNGGLKIHIKRTPIQPKLDQNL